jgi:YVTN family beta-propeller protein
MRQIFKIFLVFGFLLLSMIKVYSQVQTGFQRGNQPSDIVITPDGYRVYATAMGTHNVFVIDTQTDCIIDVIDLCSNDFNGAWPIRAVITPDGSTIYVANIMSENISVIDTDNNRVIATIEIGHLVHELAITPYGKYLYVNMGWDRVYVVEVSSNTIIKTILLENGDQTFTIAASNDGNNVYVVSQAEGGRIYTIDVATNNIIDLFELHKNLSDHGMLTVSPDDSKLYLPCGITTTSQENPTEGVNKVYVIDLASKFVTAEIEIIGGPIAIRLSADGQLGYVSTFAANKVFVVDITSNTVIDEIYWNGVLTGEHEWRRGDLRDMVFTPDETKLYITGWDGDAILVADLETKSMISSIDLNEITGQVYEIAIAPDGNRIYVSKESTTKPQVSTGLFVIDSQTNLLIDEIAKMSYQTGYPHCPNITPDGKFLYAIAEHQLIGVDLVTNEIVKEISLGDSCWFPYDIAIVHNQDKAYVTDMGNPDSTAKHIYVVDLVLNKMVKKIDVGPWSQMVVVSPDGSRAYVSRHANPWDIGSLEIIETATDQVIGTIAPPDGTTGAHGRYALLAIAPDEAHIYWVTDPDRLNIVDMASNKVTKSIDPATEKDSWAKRGIHPSDIAFTSDGSRAYIPCGDAYYVIVWDVETETIIDHIVDVGLEPVTIVITPDDKYAYVTNKESEDVSVIDLRSNTIIARISINGQEQTNLYDEPIVNYPNGYFLSQNFPNPFNLETNIKFQIQDINNVTLKIYTVHGQEVATLVNEEMIPGSYEATWNARNFTSGVYYYKLKVGTYVESRKLMLIK